MPAKYKEICDSEDEDALLSPITNADRRVATASRVEVVPADLELPTAIEAPAENSTGSTGEQLRQAHLDLMAPTQEAMSAIAPASSLSSNHVRPKRRLTGVDATPPPSSAIRKAKRVKTSPTFSSQSASNDTVPGATFPNQDVGTTSDTIAGESIPAIISDIRHYEQPASGDARCNPSRRETLSENVSSSLTPWSISAVGNSSAHGSTTHDNATDPLYSEDHFDGLPVENYKPRPSRSRSEKVLLEASIDFSKRPEKGTKPKRARTIAHSPVKSDSPEGRTGPKIFPERPILQAPEYEPLSPPLGDIHTIFSPIPEFPLLDDTLPQTIPETTGCETPLSKPATRRVGRPAKATAAKASKTAQKTPGKRGRPRKIPIPEELPDEADELGHASKSSAHSPQRQDWSGDNKGDVEVQVVITPREGTPIGAAEAGREQAPDVMSILNALNEKFPIRNPDLEASEAVLDGTMSAHKPNDDEMESSAKHENAGVTETSRASLKAKSPNLKATKAFKVPSVSISHDTTPAKVEQKVDPTSSNDQSAANASAVTGKCSMAKSSLMTGRGPIYRVGLSKTQRTQSLLKVFRK